MTGQNPAQNQLTHFRIIGTKPNSIPVLFLLLSTHNSLITSFSTSFYPFTTLSEPHSLPLYYPLTTLSEPHSLPLSILSQLSQNLILLFKSSHNSLRGSFSCSTPLFLSFFCISHYISILRTTVKKCTSSYKKNVFLSTLQ